MQVPSRFGSMCCFATSFSVSGLQSSSSEICLSRLVSETEASAEGVARPRRRHVAGSAAVQLLQARQNGCWRAVRPAARAKRLKGGV